VTNQGTQFTSNLVKDFIEQYQIKHMKSTPYHPQENGEVESTNKVIESILTKIVQLHHKDWVDRLLESLWAYRIT
jgi:transposase InsO family protein